MLAAEVYQLLFNVTDPLSPANVLKYRKDSEGRK